MKIKNMNYLDLLKKIYYNNIMIEEEVANIVNPNKFKKNTYNLLSNIQKEIMGNKRTLINMKKLKRNQTLQNVPEITEFKKII